MDNQFLALNLGQRRALIVALADHLYLHFRGDPAPRQKARDRASAMIGMLNQLLRCELLVGPGYVTTAVRCCPDCWHPNATDLMVSDYIDQGQLIRCGQFPALPCERCHTVMAPLTLEQPAN